MNIVKAAATKMEEPSNRSEESSTPTADNTTSGENPKIEPGGESQEIAGSGYNSEDDEHIHQLQATGALQEVVGSQSILSQEICCLEERYGGETTTISNDINNDNDNCQEPESQEITVDDMNGLGLSQSTVATADFSSQSMAQKFGLLSQDAAAAIDDDDDADGNVDNAEHKLKADVPTKTITSNKATQSSPPRVKHHLLNFAKFGTLLDAVHRKEHEDYIQSVDTSPQRKILSTCNIHFYDTNVVDAMAVKTMAEDDDDVEDLQFSQFSQMSTDSAIHKTVLPADTSSLPKPIRIAIAAVAEGAPTADAFLSSTEDGRKKGSATGKPNPVKSSSTENDVNRKISPGGTVAAVHLATDPSAASRKHQPLAAVDQNHKVQKVTNPHTLKRKRNATEKHEEQVVAQRAAALAKRTIDDPDLAKRLLLSMALTRENPRSAPSTLPPKGAIIPEGFFWAHYPPLEGVLKEHMAEYYELSITKCQSATQQEFNNRLVGFVRAESNRHGWLFDKCFDDKSIRDRVRCYYKTHIQNAKKRLRTMVKNPTKRANARHLCAHLDLIEKYGGQVNTEAVIDDNTSTDDKNDDTSCAPESQDEKRKVEDASDDDSDSPKRRQTETGFVKGGENASKAVPVAVGL